MAPRGGRILGAGKPAIPFRVKAAAVGLPVSAVLLWLFWSPLVTALAPTLVPIAGPVLPRPDGAPGSAKASWNPEHGVIWRDCREAAGGHVSAEWWSEGGFYRAWVTPAGGCGRPAHDDTPMALRLSGHGTPVLVLERLSAPPQASMRREVCDDAAARGLATHASVAAAANRREAGGDLRRVLGAFTALQPNLKWARPGGQVISSQICNFRDQPPPKPGQVPNAITLNLGPG